MTIDKEYSTVADVSGWASGVNSGTPKELTFTFFDNYGLGNILGPITFTLQGADGTLK